MQKFSENLRLSPASLSNKHFYGLHPVQNVDPTVQIKPVCQSP